MRSIVAVLCFIMLSGCATVFSGYTSEVMINNPPDSLRVFTPDGIELPLSYNETKFVAEYHPNHTVTSHEVVDSTRCSVQVRSNRDYILSLRTGGSEYRYPIYAKLNGWWFALDLICGGAPIIVDGITGNWNYYDPINFKK